MDVKTLATRSVSGLIYVAIITGCILWGQTGVTALSILFATIAVIEFEKITSGGNRLPIPAVVTDIIGVIALIFTPCCPMTIFPIWVLIMLARMTMELYFKSESPLKNISRSALTQIYIGIPFALMVATGGMLQSTMPLLAIFLMIWLNDTGAFLVGCTIGRHKLFERVSPKKSWEGFFGGLVFVLAAALAIGLWGTTFFGYDRSVLVWLGLGLTVTVFSTWGDLFESLIKRTLHIKDSGNIIPGHGGILDRIDSLLFVIPASFVYFVVVG